MPRFTRQFDVAMLSRWTKENPGSVIEALLDCWARPGTATSEARPLRLAVRDGYLSFYVKGQCVAKLVLNGKGLQLFVHEAYVSGRRRPVEAGGPPKSQNAVKFDAAKMSAPETVVAIKTWISTAETYAKAEKRFVDDLISTNPGIIDIEMALPTLEDQEGPKTAPRMDIVVAQTEGDAASIAFWEAKLASNTEFRARSDYAPEDKAAGPKVLHQLTSYRSWIKQSDRYAEVLTAYQNLAQVLSDLNQSFGTKADQCLPCAAIWRELNKSSAPSIILDPGVVIGNYCPHGYTDQIGSGSLSNNAASFARNGHRAKLERHGIVVCEAEAFGQVLPAIDVALAN